MKTTLFVFATCGLALSTLLFPGRAGAQETIFSNIRGIVTDATGSRVPGAKIEIFNQGTNVSHSTLIGEDGGYGFEAIVSGVYTITVEAVGFKKYVRSDIDLSNSKTIRIDPVLEVGNLTETITVTGGAPIETQVPTISVSLSKEYLNQVPAGGGSNYRILQTFFNLVPGGNSGGYNGTRPSTVCPTRDSRNGRRSTESAS